MDKDAKIIDLKQTVFALCSKDSAIAEILNDLGFKDIVKPGMLQTAGRFMTIPKGATMKKIDIEKIKQTFVQNGYQILE